MARERIFNAGGAPPVVWLLAGIFVALEALFQLGDSLTPAMQELHWQALLKLGFWDLYFETARKGGAVPWWFWTSFVTYAFLHGGMLHLLMNTAIFLALGGALARQIGALRFLILFAVTSAFAALVFAMIANTEGPLVGASGAIFGFFGALKRWEWIWLQETGLPKHRFWRTIIGLVIINAILFLGYQGGVVAWEAHLGGFIAGWFLAPALAPGRAGPAPF